MKRVLVMALILLAALSSCSQSKKQKPAEDAGTDVDTDADTDTETSSDTDTGTGTEGVGEVANLCWIETFGSPGIDQVSALGRLTDESVVVGGWCGPDAVFAEGEENETVLDGADPGFTCLARYSLDGALIWAKRITVSSYEDGLIDGPPMDVLTGTADGGFIAVGHFFGEAVFGEGEDNETTLESNDELFFMETDIFLARYSSDGALIWARRDGDSQWERVWAAIELPDGAIQATGSFKTYTRLGCGDETETYVEQYQGVSVGTYQQFVAQYHANGVLNWAAAEGGQSTGKSIAALGLDLFATVGVYPDYDEMDGATFGFEQENETVLNSEWDQGGFVSVLDAEGRLEWARGAACMDDVMFCSVATPGDGSLLVAGQFFVLLAFETDGDPIELYGEWGEGEIVLVSYGGSGDLLWTAATRSPEGDFGKDHSECVRVAPLSSGDVLVNASLRGSANLELLDPDSTSSLPCNLATIVDEDEAEPIAARYDDALSVEWCARLAHNWQDVESGLSAVNDDGTFYVAGQFTGDAEVEVQGETVAISSQIEESESRADGFLMRVCP